MTRQDRAIAALAALRADGWTLPTSTVPIDLLLDTKADALDVIAERDSLRAEVERLTDMTATPEESRRMFADGEARIRAEERAKIAAWLEARHRARSCRLSDEFREGRQNELADIIDAITNNEHNAP